MSNIVIVGAGLAALRAAERLRDLRYEGRITMVGDEPRCPYNRTPLSKALLTGHVAIEDLRLPVWSELDITWRLGARATLLDVDERLLCLPGGERLTYDGLILAGGVQARHLPGTPMHSPHVWMLRTLNDARQIDRLLERAGHVAVIGGGFIGCELASTCRRRVLDVTIIDVSPHVLTRGLGAQLGAVVGDIHADHGVKLHLGVAVKSWEEHPDGVTVLLQNGERIDADVAVVGVGTVPDTDWLTASALDVSDGILCTATCHAVGARDIVACGDIARWPNLRFGMEPQRIEHWLNAIEMGQHAAESLLRGPDNALAFCPIPRFWSEQHDHRIQSVGRPELGDQLTITEGTLASRRFVATSTRDGVLVGAIGIDSPRRMIHFADLVDQRWPAVGANAQLAA